MFITLEGIEGVGKSTHATYIKGVLVSMGHEVVMTREPGGTETGESIREILLHSQSMHISDITELMLIFTARAQHLDEVICPALTKNKVVLCDRFTDATYAYQGGGRGLAQERIKVLEELVQQGLRPGLTILFDAPVAVGLDRVGKRSTADRFESEEVGFFEKVRNYYLSIAEAEPKRVRIINVSQPIEEIQKELSGLLKSVC